MKSLTERVFAGLLLLCILHPASGLACAIVTKEEAVRRQQVRIEESKAEALALHDEADLVFVGNLSQLTRIRETVKQGSLPGVVLHTYQGVFEFVDNIKGTYSKGLALEFTINKNLVYVGCGSVPFRSSLPKENGAGERYLVYARGGEILRTNHIPQDVQVLTGREEAGYLRGVGR